MHEAARPAGARGIESVARTEHVHPPDRLRLVAHRDDCRGVHDEVESLRSKLPIARVRDVAGHAPALGIAVKIDAPDLAAAGAEVVGYRAPDEAERACDEDARGLSHRRRRPLPTAAGGA